MSKSAVAAIAERFRSIPTSTIFDVMDHRGLGDTSCLSHEISALRPHARIAGPAHTIRWVRDPRLRSEWNPPMLPTIADMFTPIEEGDVVVVSGGDDKGAGHWGEMLSTMAHVSGAVGAVVDGGTRDSEGILAMEGFEAFARYNSPIEGASRLRVHAVGVPLLLDGALGARVSIRPGDWVVGDPDGVLVIPAERTNEILKASEELEILEDETRQALRAGQDFNEVYAKFGRG